MNNTISNFLYSGNATLKFCRNGVVYKTVTNHNTAEDIFITYILRAITGDRDAVDQMPKFLSLFGNKDGKDIDLLLYKIPISRAYIDDGPIARFVGYIPYGAFADANGNQQYSTNINKLKIYNSAASVPANQLLATVKFPEINTTLTEGTTVIVEWTVSITDTASTTDESSTTSKETTRSTPVSNRTLLKKVSK